MVAGRNGNKFRSRLAPFIQKKKEQPQLEPYAHSHSTHGVRGQRSTTFSVSQRSPWVQHPVETDDGSRFHGKLKQVFHKKVPHSTTPTTPQWEAAFATCCSSPPAFNPVKHNQYCFQLHWIWAYVVDRNFLNKVHFKHFWFTSVSLCIIGEEDVQARVKIEILKSE